MRLKKAQLRRHRLVLVGIICALSLALVSAIKMPSFAGKTAIQARPGVRTIMPAGSLVIDATTRQPAVGALPVDLVRSPDHSGADVKGRYLVAVNSGFGIQFNAAGNRGQQSLAVIDLNAQPAPLVIQNVYFPSPQSVNVGVVFAPVADADGSFALYASGGFENKIWILRFVPGSQTPITPNSPGPNTEVKAPFIDLNGLAAFAPSPRYNSNHAPVYPCGLAISSDGNVLFVADNLGDSLGIVSDLHGARKFERIDLPGHNRGLQETAEHFVYPYGVVALPWPPENGNSEARRTGAANTHKVFVSLWNDDSVAVLDYSNDKQRLSYIPVGHHPTAMIWDGTRSRLYVVNSNADSVSMIDTRYDREVERIDVKLSEETKVGGSPEGLALNADGTILYVANAHSNSVAVVVLSQTSLDNSGSADRPAYLKRKPDDRSKVRGFIPTGQYPSAVAVADRTIFIGNGKGTGFESSSLVVNESGLAPNAPNDRFPVGSGRGSAQGGEYSVTIVAGNISNVTEPDDPTLARYTQQVLRNDGLIGVQRKRLFPGASPIKHVIYVIKENRTYDQVFGDVEHAGDGQKADGDARLAIFGAGDAARKPNGPAQNITPNHHALALRFGLLDRFLVNAEASADGHNWSTAAFSNDYTDKAYRWNYSRRGRGYDFEGFNRLPDYEPMRDTPSLFPRSVETEDIANFMRRFIPYLHGSRDVAEPDTLYLWDAAARAGLSYRNYGEFVATLSENDVKAIRINRSKSYPDISPNASAFPTKKSLEGHFSSAFRNFDLDSPDSMTVESYRKAKASAGKIDATITPNNTDSQFRGSSRIGVWREEFHGFVADREAGKPDRMPNLSIVRMPNDHTEGLKAGSPTPQFFVADNDYAIGELVAAVSNSPYWKDTAIVMVEDDAQDGPDHVDAHRSVALVISAYNRPGALVHELHTTVSLIRTIEMLLGIEPMNQLDESATPIDIFQSEPDLRPYTAQLPSLTLDNLVTPPARDTVTDSWMKRTTDQDLSHADMADARTLNEIIWFSVRGEEQSMPAVARLPVFDALRLGVRGDANEQSVATTKGGAGLRKADPDD